MTSTPAGQARTSGLLRTFVWPILAVGVLTAVTAVAVLDAREPVYVSTGSVLLHPDRQGGAPVLPQMGTERAIASSSEVADRAAESLEVTPSVASRHLEVTVPVDANVVELSYSASSPKDARDGAEAFTQAYVDYRNLDLRNPLAQVISEPEVPDRPQPRNYAVVAVIGLVAGLVLGFVSAFVWDRVAGRLRGPGDAARVTGTDILASVPARAMIEAPLERGPSGFAHLAARLSNRMPSGGCLMVTAPRRGAGATTVASNLAVALADLGREVVLVSGNFRRPDVHRVLGLPRAPGVTEVLRGQVDLAEAVRPTSKPGLRALTAGSPGETSGVDVGKYLGILARLSADVVVVVDAVPVLEVPDTVLVGNGCTLTVLVVDVRRGSRKDAVDAVDSLRGLAGTLAGLVANRPPRGRRNDSVAPTAGPRGDVDPKPLPSPRMTKTGSNRNAARNPI